MQHFFSVVTFLVAAALSYIAFILSKKNKKLQAQLDSLNVDLEKANVYINSLKVEIGSRSQSSVQLLEYQEKEKSKLEYENKNLTDKINELSSENGELKAIKENLSEKLSVQKEELSQMNKTFQLQFKETASTVLDEKAEKLTETNKSALENILKPLSENIASFKKKVEETYDKESKQRFSLEERVKELVEQTNKISSEANNLATALKGNSKKQGDWGEMILESVLQNSGLAKNREYFVQKSVKDEEGNSTRPDITVKLPDDKIVIIDSKVSLTDYERYSNSDDTEQQNLFLKQHLFSLKKHIDELSQKKYDDNEKSLGFVLLFVPIEPAYLAAIQKDCNLWTYAYKKGIVLLSPTNLIVCLKLINDLWRKERQNRNALEIARIGGSMFDKFVSFVNAIETIGKNIAKTQDVYNEALSQLKTGRGNLVDKALKLKELGINSNKEMPLTMIPLEFTSQEQQEET
ncbi:MAG: DNA recombination protein RmuC [Elusimicrobiota bacterium]|jgi:DNA recombination protein RmuC|nr:DNA recombination protein RmuC [Elusimicrobiota bacterium]